MSVETGPGTDLEPPGQSSLSTEAARNLTTTTKSVPQMQGRSSRALLRALPWVEVKGGTYRVNRRLTYTLGDGRLEFVQDGAEVRAIPRKLGELGLLRGFDDLRVLTELAGRCVQRDFRAGEVLAERGAPADRMHLIAHGRIRRTSVGKYGDVNRLGVLADGDRFGEHALLSGEDSVQESVPAWDFTATAETSGTVLTLSRDDFAAVLSAAPGLQAHVQRVASRSLRPQNRHGEADVALSAGHTGEVVLPSTFVDYEPRPREYELSLAQTVLRIHTRVADLYNGPMDQTEEQLRLTVEALRERQEHELVNNREFGLLHNAAFAQRIQPRSGPPTPDDLDDLLSLRRDTTVFVAHPKAIAAMGRQFNAHGLYPDHVDRGGQQVPAWRGVPILPCNKIPVSKESTSSILAMRLGEDDQGVVGLRQTGLPEEREPGLSVQSMGISDQAITTYLVSTYFSAAVLVPDALGILENVQIAPLSD